MGAVGSPGAVVSDVKVGGSVFGKYPPPIETTEPCLEVADCDMGEISLCDDWL
jgi:hypothetical protein